MFTICSLLLPYGYQVTRANRIPPARYIVIGVQRALALVGAQWLARFVRDPEVYIMVSFSDLRRGVAQWLARFVRDEEAGGSSPLTPTISLRNKSDQVPYLVTSDSIKRKFRT